MEIDNAKAEPGSGGFDSRILQDPEERLLVVLVDVVRAAELPFQEDDFGGKGTRIEIDHTGADVADDGGRGGGARAVAGRGEVEAGVGEEAGGDAVGDERGAVAEDERESGGEEVGEERDEG